MRLLPFSMIIVRDSNAHHLAKLLPLRVTSVNGICSPIAKLAGALAWGNPPTGSCCILLAGSNDVGVNETKTLSNSCSRKLHVVYLPRWSWPPFHRGLTCQGDIPFTNKPSWSTTTSAYVGRGDWLDHIQRRSFTRHRMLLQHPGNGFWRTLCWGVSQGLFEFLAQENYRG